MLRNRVPATAFPWTHAGCFGSDGMFGVGWGAFAELAHLAAATQLRSRGHMLDASALMGCLGWGGVGMFTFAEVAHMVDATQLRSRGHMLDASAVMGCLGWGGVGMFTFAELAHLAAATQLRSRGHMLKGTQVVDRLWQALKKYLPSEISTKDRNTRGVNARLLSYVHSFQFRFNNKKLWKSTLGQPAKQGENAVKRSIQWPRHVFEMLRI